MISWMAYLYAWAAQQPGTAGSDIGLPATWVWAAGGAIVTALAGAVGRLFYGNEKKDADALKRAREDNTALKARVAELESAIAREREQRHAIELQALRDQLHATREGRADTRKAMDTVEAMVARGNK